MTVTPDSPRPWIASTATCWVSPTHSTIATCARKDGGAGCTAGRTATPVGYGYATEAGRVGPIATLDPALLAPILGHLTTAITPRGAFAMWLPGTADQAVVAALRAGFRLDAFPILLCWDRPFADLDAVHADLTRTALDPPAPDHRPGVAGPVVPFGRCPGRW